MKVICGVFDLPAKASILNMMYFNGQYACITCEEPGHSVKQGKGTARCFPQQKWKYKLRSHSDVLENMQLETVKKKQLKVSCRLENAILTPRRNEGQTETPRRNTKKTRDGDVPQSADTPVVAHATQNSGKCTYHDHCNHHFERNKRIAFTGCGVLLPLQAANQSSIDPHIGVGESINNDILLKVALKYKKSNHVFK